MAQRTQVLLIDDLDGSSADETLWFGLDGSSYEIDLSAENASVLRAALADYVANGRKISGGRGNVRRRASGSSRNSSLDTADVRAWARANGYSVNDRGRIALEIVEAYRAAN
jgi:uncharacterized membrane protein